MSDLNTISPLTSFTFGDDSDAEDGEGAEDGDAGTPPFFTLCPHCHRTTGDITYRITWWKDMSDNALLHCEFNRFPYPIASGHSTPLQIQLMLVPYYL